MSIIPDPNNRCPSKTFILDYSMKTVFCNLIGRTGCGYRAISMVALLLSGALTALGQGGFVSPLGTWDFVLSGSGQQGIAYITFTTNSSFGGNFHGFQLLSAPQNPPPVIPPPSTNSDGRNPGGDPGRGDTNEVETTTNAVSTNTINTNVFGFIEIHGPWEFNSQGQVIGFFDELLNIGTEESTNWLGGGLIANITYTVTNSDGSGYFSGSTNFTFAFTTAPYLTDVTWSATNADGITNVFSENFVLTTNGFSVALAYTVNGSGGTNIFSNDANDTFITGAGDTIVADGMIVSKISTNVTLPTLNSSYSFTSSESVSVSIAGSATNQISFWGRVGPAREHFVMTSYPSLSQGKVIYTGVPYRTSVADVAGDWYGTKSEGGHPYLEFFTLAPFTSGNPFSPDISDFVTNFPTLYYSTNGAGPGYGLSVISMVSAHQRIGFAFSAVGDGGGSNVLSATFGPVTTTRGIVRANTVGDEEPFTRISFKGALQP